VKQDTITMLNMFTWIAGVAFVVSAAWGVDPRLGRACLGLALIWFSRPMLWRMPK
jgi:hypothetical protein